MPSITKCLFVAFLLLCTTASVSAYAYDPPPETSEETNAKDECIELLHDRHYAELEKKFSGYQSQYEQGKISDVSLLHVARAFYLTAPELEKNYNDWVKAYPSSYSAHLARGTYFLSLALEARGAKFINQTPPEQLVLMNNYMNKALPDLLASVRMTAKPIVTLFHIHIIYKASGELEGENKILEVANKMDPKNFIVRYEHLKGLETRWGGDFEQMTSFRMRCEQEGMIHYYLKYFDELIAQEHDCLNHVCRK